MTDKLYWKTKRYVKLHNITMEQLANAVGYTRCYFSYVLNEGIESPRLEAKLIKFLKTHKKGL